MPRKFTKKEREALERLEALAEWLKRLVAEEKHPGAIAYTIALICVETKRQFQDSGLDGFSEADFRKGFFPEWKKRKTLREAAIKKLREGEDPTL